jgi:hypothetical protein
MLTDEKEVPLSYAQAICDPRWQAAIQKELDAMEKYQVWTIVPCEKAKQVLPVKWIFSIKSNGVYKARLVLVGCRDREVYSKAEVASPTPAPATVRWFIAHAIQRGWSLMQIDFDYAFLNGFIDREKYIFLPSVVKGDSRTSVCNLQKAMYGLTTAPKCWYQRLSTFLVNAGFHASEREPCIFTWKKNEDRVIFLVYVDDVLLSGTSEKVLELIIAQIKQEFVISVLGFPETFLGFQFEKLENGALLLHQERYVLESLNTFNVCNCKPVKTPMAPFGGVNNVVREWNRCFTYKQVIGTLLYLANTTRPDLAFAVNYLARYQAEPREEQWTMIHRVFRYLKTNPKLGLVYRKRENMSVMDVYVDADFGGDARTRRSTSAFTIWLFGNTINWASKLQQCIAESSGEAEYIAICDALRSALFHARLSEEVAELQPFPIVIYEDNNAAISQCLSTCSKGRVKHIELKLLKIREYFQNGVASVNKVGTARQLADILTKPVSEKAFLTLRSEVFDSASAATPM